MKKPFLYGLRGKAQWRMNWFVLCYFVFFLIYFRIGNKSWIIETAKDVPLLWKCLVFVALFASIWYADRRINNCGFDRTLPRLKPGWILWIPFIALTFAIVTADTRTLFYVGTLVSAIYCWASHKYFKRKWDKLNKYGASFPS